jgi:hypothetical protein
MAVTYTLVNYGKRLRSYVAMLALAFTINIVIILLLIKTWDRVNKPFLYYNYLSIFENKNDHYL